MYSVTVYEECRGGVVADCPKEQQDFLLLRYQQFLRALENPPAAIPRNIKDMPLVDLEEVLDIQYVDRNRSLDHISPIPKAEYFIKQRRKTLIYLWGYKAKIRTYVCFCIPFLV